MLDVFEPTIWPFDMDIPFVSHWSRREYRSRSLIDHRLQYSTDVAKFRRTPIIVVGAPRWTGQAHVCRDCGLRSNYILRSTLLKSARSLNKRSAPATIHLRVRPIGRILSCSDLNQAKLSLEPRSLALTIRPATKLQKSFGARMVYEDDQAARTLRRCAIAILQSESSS
jgi:hypothetical protein